MKKELNEKIEKSNDLQANIIDNLKKNLVQIQTENYNNINYIFENLKQLTALIIKDKNNNNTNPKNKKKWNQNHKNQQIKLNYHIDEIDKEKDSNNKKDDLISLKEKVREKEKDNNIINNLDLQNKIKTKNILYRIKNRRKRNLQIFFFKRTLEKHEY